ncbi:SAM-dependent methyltransferase [Actinocrispum wychmicini]|uniref:S-adenosyl methyltransferase n=1 Tax=Actinocrispum wychmicini TaxID=1213861 RepID=A0A4R2J4D0_9PSEU|nr:SAM-dependent methyltransferase [Actinocrispum wychmicini]TCO53551.1 S-adenosyl methyltransferase [Actinocrispum wychmicini]
MTEAAIEWVPTGVDEEVPSAARVYDYLLGGGHNFSADRGLAENLLKVLPARDMARLNRQYLDRVVRYLISQGITQFLDLGSGIPTVGNVHEVAQKINPAARVVYVDNEAVAVAHSELLLRDNQNAAAIMADMRAPVTIFNNPEVRRLLDFSQPLGLLMVGVVQFVPDDDDPWRMAEEYRNKLASGSYLALSAFTFDNAPEGMQAAIEVFKNSRDPIYPRTHADLLRMFGDFDLVDPGLVYTPEWRPDRPVSPSDASRSNLYAGVGVKR